jgi:hypothetical protein
MEEKQNINVNVIDDVSAVDDPMGYTPPIIEETAVREAKAGVPPDPWGMAPEENLTVSQI